MVFVLIDTDAKTISIRQSWLGTALRCPNRGRLAIIKPEFDVTGDAAAAGTAMHTAIQAVLDGKIDLDGIRAKAKNAALDLMANEQIAFKSFTGPDELIHHAVNCAQGWANDIYPIVQPLGVAGTEVLFDFPAFVHRDWTIRFQGQCDLIPQYSNTLWDWKSSGSVWKQRDKQRTDVQATIYGLAALNGCFDRDDFYWPLDFNFGVMVRTMGVRKPSSGTIITVQRDAQHARWVERRVRQFVDLYLDLGLDTEWPALDDHYLCSEKWCPWYSLCRGCHLTATDDMFGMAA